MISSRCQLLVAAHTCNALRPTELQLQSKLSDNVSYLSHYGINFMAAQIKYAFPMMMSVRCDFAAFIIFFPSPTVNNKLLCSE